MRQLNALSLAAILSLSLSTIGCNEFQANKSGAVSSSSLSTPNGNDGGATLPDADIDMEALNKDIDDVELSLADVDKEVAKINLPMLSLGQSKLAQEGLSKNLRKVFDKLVMAISKVFGKVDDLRAEIKSKMAKLDPMNPLHIALIIKLNDVLAYLDQLDLRLADNLNNIVAKIDGVVANVDGKIAAMNPKNPLSWAALILWEQVKQVISEFKVKLADLAKP